MVTTPTGWSRRTLHLGSLFAAAVVVGVGVWLAARAFGAGSCPEHDALPVASSCRALVGSLAVRVGALAGAAVVVMDLTSAGLSGRPNPWTRSAEPPSGSVGPAPTAATSSTSDD